MLKIENTDLLSLMKKIVDKNVKNYTEDFNGKTDYSDIFVVNDINKGNNRRFVNKDALWIVRDSGTHLFPLVDVCLKDTESSIIFNFWKNDNAKVYMIHVNDMEKNNKNITGNLYELNYQKTVDFINKNAMTSDNIKLYDGNGNSEIMNYKEYVKECRYGNYEKFNNIVTSERIPNDQIRFDIMIRRFKNEIMKPKNQIETKAKSMSQEKRGER